MKKIKLLKRLALLVTLCSILCLTVACGDGHVHAYEVKEVEACQTRT